MPSPYYAKELTLINRVLNEAISTHFGAAKFSEYPAVGDVCTLTSPKGWKRLDYDRILQSGTIWIIGGWSNLAEGYGGMNVLSAKVESLEAVVNAAIEVGIEPFLRPTFEIEINWGYEVEVKAQDAKQQAPITGQIRPPYTLTLPLRAGVLAVPQTGTS